MDWRTFSKLIGQIPTDWAKTMNQSAMPSQSSVDTFLASRGLSTGSSATGPSPDTLLGSRGLFPKSTTPSQKYVARIDTTPIRKPITPPQDEAIKQLVPDNVSIPQYQATPNLTAPQIKYSTPQPSGTDKFWGTKVVGNLPLDAFVNILGKMSNALAPRSAVGRLGGALADVSHEAMLRREARERLAQKRKEQIEDITGTRAWNEYLQNKGFQNRKELLGQDWKNRRALSLDTIRERFKLEGPYKERALSIREQEEKAREAYWQGMTDLQRERLQAQSKHWSAQEQRQNEELEARRAYWDNQMKLAKQQSKDRFIEIGMKNAQDLSQDVDPSQLARVYDLIHKGFEKKLWMNKKTGKPMEVWVNLRKKQVLDEYGRPIEVDVDLFGKTSARKSLNKTTSKADIGPAMP